MSDMTEDKNENSEQANQVNNEAIEQSENLPDDDAEKISFPSGFGMSIEEIRALLAKKHETIVPKDDPILLTVTILNVFLEHQEKLNRQQLKALNGVLTERTETYIQGVKNITEGLSKTLGNITVDGIISVQEKHNLHMQCFKDNMWYATAIIALSAILNVAVFILR